MSEYREYLKRMAIVLKMSQKEKKKYRVKILEKEFVVYPEVFSPKYFSDTEIYARELPVKKGEKFLEIGCGTGIISIFSALKGASKVVAADINQNAVENCLENVKLHGLEDRIQVFQADVYRGIPENERFDTIFWNTPFGYLEKGELTVLEKSVFDPNYRSHRIFISNARHHLTKKGRLLIGFSSTLGNFAKLEELLEESGFSHSLLREIHGDGKLANVKFEIWESIIEN